MALERILEEVRRLPAVDRKKLLRELEQLEAGGETGENFEKAAGSWLDFDAGGFVHEVYARRAGSRRAGTEW
ncbi:MAG: hypothetical protein QHH75_06780 [Bacillota bacterium]|nr:hypothetical protein [Bacillota bacterium]